MERGGKERGYGEVRRGRALKKRRLGEGRWEGRRGDNGKGEDKG